MAQGPSDTILVAIRITLRIQESKVRDPYPPDRRRFVLSEHIYIVVCASAPYLYRTGAAFSNVPRKILGKLLILLLLLLLLLLLHSFVLLR